MGLFANTYFPSVNRHGQFAHFSAQAEGIPLHLPIYNKELDNWNTASLNIRIPDISKRPDIVFVKKGTVIGYVGTSGIGEGDRETFRYETQQKR